MATYVGQPTWSPIVGFTRRLDARPCDRAAAAARSHAFTAPLRGDPQRRAARWGLGRSPSRRPRRTPAGRTRSRPGPPARKVRASAAGSQGETSHGPPGGTAQQGNEPGIRQRTGWPDQQDLVRDQLRSDVAGVVVVRAEPWSAAGSDGSPGRDVGAASDQGERPRPTVGVSAGPTAAREPGSRPPRREHQDRRAACCQARRRGRSAAIHHRASRSSARATASSAAAHKSEVDGAGDEVVAAQQRQRGGGVAPRGQPLRAATAAELTRARAASTTPGGDAERPVPATRHGVTEQADRHLRPTAE